MNEPVRLDSVLRQQFKQLQARPDSEVNLNAPPATSFDENECVTCKGRGFIVVTDTSKLNEIGSAGWQQTQTCPNPSCPAVERNQKHRYDILIARCPLPKEHAKASFEKWNELAAFDAALPDNPPPEIYKMAGKWLAYAAAWAFVEARSGGFYFSLVDACHIIQADDADYDDDRYNSIVFAGQPGVGKTSLGAAITHELRRHHVPCLYVKTADLLAAIKERMRDNVEYQYNFGDTEAQIMAVFKKAPVLFLDELNLQGESASDWSRQVIEELIRYRHDHHLPTLMTTNLNDQQFKRHWHERTSVAVEAMAHWIEMSGQVLRRRRGPVKSF